MDSDKHMITYLQINNKLLNNWSKKTEDQTKQYHSMCWRFSIPFYSLSQLNARALTNGTELLILFMNLVIPWCILLWEDEWTSVDFLALILTTAWWGDVTQGPRDWTGGMDGAEDWEHAAPAEPDRKWSEGWEPDHAPSGLVTSSTCKIMKTMTW